MKVYSQDFPSGPVVKTPGFHCRGCRFNSWSRNKDLACRTMQPKKNCIEYRKFRVQKSVVYHDKEITQYTG